MTTTRALALLAGFALVGVSAALAWGERRATRWANVTDEGEA